MNKTKLISVLALALLPCLSRAETKVQYLIDVKVLQAPTNTLRITSDRVVVQPAEGEWNKKRIRFDGVDLSSLSSCDVLSAPRLTVLAGSPATIEVGQEPPQYFEKQADGSYQLRRMNADDWVGVRLMFTAKSLKELTQVAIDADLRVQSVAKRDRLKDVALDVGRPVLARNQVAFKGETIKLDEWCLIAAPKEGSGIQLLFLLKVTRVEK